MHLPIYVVFEILSFILSIAYRKHLKAFKLSLFVWLLAYVCIIEIIASNVTLMGFNTNHMVYNCYIVVIVPMYLRVFFDMLELKKWVKWLYIVLSWLVILFSLWNFLFFQGFWLFNNYSYVLFEFISCLIALMLIVKIFSEDNFDIGITGNPQFWISSGLLIFSAAGIVMYGLQQYILKNRIEIQGIKIYNIIMPLACMILYSSYGYAFYLCKRLTTYPVNNKVSNSI